MHGRFLMHRGDGRKDWAKEESRHACTCIARKKHLKAATAMVVDTSQMLRGTYALSEARAGGATSLEKSVINPWIQITITVQHNTATVTAESYRERYLSSAITITDKRHVVLIASDRR